jgi:hypothetical protein
MEEKERNLFPIRLHITSELQVAWSKKYRRKKPTVTFFAGSSFRGRLQCRVAVLPTDTLTRRAGEVGSSNGGLTPQSNEITRGPKS